MAWHGMAQDGMGPAGLLRLLSVFPQIAISCVLLYLGTKEALSEEE